MTVCQKALSRSPLWGYLLREMKLRLLLSILVLLTAPLALGQEREVRGVAEGFVKRVLGKERLEVEEFRVLLDDGTGLYAVAMVIREGKKKRPILLYLSKDKRFVFLGRIYDASTAKELSRGHFLKLMPEFARAPREVDLAKVKLRGPTLGRGQKVLLISNPSCPHCRKVVPRLIDHIKANQTYTLYYKSMPFGRDRELEWAIECVRQRRPELFWDFLRVCYREKKVEALKWLKEKAGAEFLKGCREEEIMQALKAEAKEVKEGIGIDGIPAVVVGGKLYEGRRDIERLLLENKEVRGR